jgi:UDP-N-acetylglucosamine--N-acetylmuramyl-(pentapeptide) pyrophosphoryl-undecaprenol N-acetylglucosamine transferase
LLQAWRIIGKFRPTLVLGLGGYGSVPVVLAAWLRRVPTVLLEQNVRPGLANRLLAHVSRRICTTFAESARCFPAGKAVQTGNPVRQLPSEARPSEGHFTIFIFGGSQGARTINRAAVAAAAQLVGQLPGLRIIHQTGAIDLEWVKQRYQELGLPAEVAAFVHDMGSAYSRADLVICRAGATTLAELTALAKPSILIPYPYAVDDHQRANADVLVRNGAAEIITDAELNGDSLRQAVLAVACNRGRLAAMGAAARRLAVPDAAARVVEVCRQVVAEG